MECQKQDVDWSALVIFRSDSFNDQASDCNRDGLGLKINGPGTYKAHYNPPQIIDLLQHRTKHWGMFKSFSHDSTFVQYGVRWFNVPLSMTQFTPILGLGLDLIFWEVILLWHYIWADRKDSEIKLGQINYCLPGSICNIHNCAWLEMQNCVRHRFALMLILGLVANSNGGLNETEQG